MWQQRMRDALFLNINEIKTLEKYLACHEVST